MITCSSVSASSAWYQRVLGLTSTHGGEEYERLVHDGELVLQLHEIDAHDHPELVGDGGRIGGDGVALWFESESFDAAVERIRAAGVEPVEDVHVNPAAQHREIWLRDPDGYLVVLSSPSGDTG